MFLRHRDWIGDAVVFSAAEKVAAAHPHELFYL
jgi:hypothetical protein